MSIDSGIASLADTASSFPQVFSVQQILWENLACDYLRLHHSTFPEHIHSLVQISIVVVSSARSSVIAHWQGPGKRQHQSLVEGDCCIVPSEQPHTITWEHDAEVVSILLAPDYIAHAAYDVLANKGLEFAGQYGMNDPFIRQLGVTLLNAFRCGQPGKLYVESLATVLAVHLCQNHAVSSSKLSTSIKSLAPHILRSIIEYIDVHLCEDLSLSQLASMVQISPFHLSRVFKQTMGITLHQYVIVRRIERAKVLLSENRWSVLEIGHIVGLQNQSHLTALFRKHVGMTPQQYRRNRMAL